MNTSNSLLREEVIERRIILELPSVKKTYEKYCKDLGTKRLQEMSSDDTLLNLVRTRDEKERHSDIYSGKPFMEFQLLDLLYDIKFNEKSVKDRSFSISAENYLLSKIMAQFTSLGLPQYRKYELSQQLRFNIDEVFYNKISRGYFGLIYFEVERSPMIFDYILTYIKYHRNVKYFRDDEMTKYGYNFVAKGEMMSEILPSVRNIHYKERTSKNHLLFYLLYLTIYEGTELYLIYDHDEFLNYFKICSTRGCKQYIKKGCTILGLYDILTEAFQLFGSNDKPILSKDKMRDEVLDDIIEASEKTTTFEYKVYGGSGIPMLGQVSFIHTDPSKYDDLKRYAGEYGGVIPMTGHGNKKILDGKKKLNYKKSRKDNNKP